MRFLLFAYSALFAATEYSQHELYARVRLLVPRGPRAALARPLATEFRALDATLSDRVAHRVPEFR